MPDPSATAERQLLAEYFLQEAVYRSREKQTQEASLPSGADGGPGTCGLGEKAAVELDLSERGRELFGQIFAESTAEERGAIQAVMTDWIRRQDALDRKRNHFMKDFRNAHGFDRGAYSSEEEVAWRAGIDGVNAEIDAERASAARALLKLR